MTDPNIAMEEHIIHTKKIMCAESNEALRLFWNNISTKNQEFQSEVRASLHNIQNQLNSQVPRYEPRNDPQFIQQQARTDELFQLVNQLQSQIN